MVDADFSARITSFEQKFNCLICWTPNLRMIYGSCQHRLCENCLYDKEGKRRLGIERCPTCQRENAFPSTRPDVPEDNIEIQVQLGVRKCPNSGCKLQMWYWDLPDHLHGCQFVSSSLGGTKQIKRKSLDESGLEIKKTMTLRSRTKDSTQHKNKVAGRRKKQHNLRPRKGKKRKVTLTIST